MRAALSRCDPVVAADAPMAALASLGRVAARVWRRGREALRRAGRSRPPFRRNLIFEALEQRILLSVDLALVAPGTLVHATTQSGTFATADQDVSYTLSLDAAQHVSVSLAAQDPSLQARIRL